MNVTPTCFSKCCNKPRFLEYYVCAEHFIFYAAPRYTEPMVNKVKPLAYSEFWYIYPEPTACSSSQPKHTAGKSLEREIPSEVNRARNTH
jgi:hypothetical protein